MARNRAVRNQWGHRPTWPDRGAPGVGLQRVRFEILSIDEYDETKALVTVLSRPPGRRRVTEETEIGTLLVYDLAGCFFDENPEDLEGRIGYATYLETRDEYDVPTKKWEVDSLCCPP